MRSHTGDAAQRICSVTATITTPGDFQALSSIFNLNYRMTLQPVEAAQTQGSPSQTQQEGPTQTYHRIIEWLGWKGP